MKTTVPLLVLLLGAPCLAAPVSISVVDDKGTPIPGADVQLQSYVKVPKGLVSKITDAQGLASFDIELPDADTNFLGRVAVWKDEFALGGGNLTQSTPLKVVLRPSNTVSGTITDEAKHPIAGAKISFSSYSSPGRLNSVYLFESPLQQKMQVVSQADGSWKLSHIPPDVSVRVAIEAEKWASASALIQVGTSTQTTLHPGATIQGRLLGLKGEPLAGVRVYASQLDRDMGSRSYGSEKTSDDGTFRLSGLEPGRYSVSYNTEDNAPFVVASNESVSTSAEKPTQLPDAHAEEGTVISGQVVAQDTKAPVEGAYVILQSDTGSSTNSATTDAKGHWQIRTLAKTGTVSLNGVPREFVRDSQERQKAIFDAETHKSDLNFAVERSVKIVGRLVDENGRGVQTSNLVLRQNYDEFPLKTDADGNFTAYGPKAGEVEIGTSRWSGEVEEGSVQWDVIGANKISVPSLKPIQFKVKRAQLFNLELGVFDQDDAALEGVKVGIELSTRDGDHGTSRPVSLVSDKTGRIHLDGIRANETVEVKSATKEGFDLASLPKVQKDNDIYRADISLTKRDGAANGQVFDTRNTLAESVSIYGSEVETTSDATGHFSLAPLPTGKTEIVAWKDDGFSLASSDATRLDLKPQTLEPTNRPRAQEVLDALRTETKDTQYWRRRDLALENPTGTFEETAQLVSAEKFGLYRLIMRFASDTSISQDKWLTALQSAKTPSERLYSVTLWNSRVPSVAANDATRSLFLSLEGDAAQTEKVGDASNRWQNAIGLFGVAALAERLGETDKADEWFEHANAYVQKNFPEKGDDRGNQSQDDTYGVMGEIVAVSPRLLTKLVALVDTDSAAYSRLLQDGSPTIARLSGLDAARPFLDLLKKAPPPQPDSRGNSSSIEWALNQAVITSIRVGGKANPQLALELAKSLPSKPIWSNDNSRASALCEAAFFQTPEVAQALWHDSLPQLEPSAAMRFIARIAQLNQAQARDFYEIVRQKLDTQPDKNDDATYYQDPQTAAFVFYEAKFNPARARYRLEKAFQKSCKNPNSRYYVGDYIRVMAIFDVNRALAWANQAGNVDNNFAGFEGKRMIVRWLSLDEVGRSKVNLGDRFNREDEF